MSRQVCADYGRLGIRSNVIRLGRMMVPANREAYEDPDHMERARDRVMTPSVAQPSDLAAVAFLASDASRFINGSIVELDGGEMSLMT